ncbi:hypothetical protein B0H67DRAFT_393913 [Lasiosphaeris hirsuta]|uniref:Uncharacterized protein n=1 Tax=Lasiosphaeris hirsuta TaxID=260670 RepID=A0AA39ZRD2_9PEZI|nr:hypothetical protein B0H67DRAFT_393913 [Lasiosphaeris hirsuta]
MTPQHDCHFAQQSTSGTLYARFTHKHQLETVERMSRNNTIATTRASSTTLRDQDQDQDQENSNAEQSSTRPRYVYVEKVSEPKPDAAPKIKSRISKFMSKFQSPAVRATKAAREREQLEEVRTGVKKYQAMDVSRSSNGWALS